MGDPPDVTVSGVVRDAYRERPFNPGLLRTWKS